MSKIPVKVIIPIYKNELNSDEQRSLQQCCKVLAAYPIVFVTPRSLDISSWLNLYPACTVESFDDHFFESIAGYNALMLNRQFYERFLDTEYILIHQLDAYVFKDALMEWVNKGYDYVGAPWILKPKYHRFYYRILLAIRSFAYWIQRKPFNLMIVGDKVGNGGFSLRKVQSHYLQTEIQAKKIAYFLRKSATHQEFNEDVFWATQNPTFVYPTWQEAIFFALDTYPELGYQLMNEEHPLDAMAGNVRKHLFFGKKKLRIKNCEGNVKQ